MIEQFIEYNDTSWNSSFTITVNDNCVGFATKRFGFESIWWDNHEKEDFDNFINALIAARDKKWPKQA